jgi:hypothetical protein
MAFPRPETLMPAIHRLLGAASLIVAVGCGGSDKAVTDPNPSGTGKDMSAKVDGGAWVATTVGTFKSTNGLIISGTTAAIGISLGFSTIQGTGTQIIGGTGATGLGLVTTATQSWESNGQQGSGTVTLTTLTATRVVGTFTFTAPLFGTVGPPATRTVTSGKFDVTF